MWRVALLAALAAGCRSGTDRGPRPGEPPEVASAPSVSGSARLAPARVAASADVPAHAAAPPASAGEASILLPLELHVLTDDVTMVAGGAKPAVFSYRDWARAAFAHDLALLGEPDAALPLTIRELDVTVLAWVGSFVSFEEKTFTTTPGHEAHPSGEVGYVTLRIEPTPAQARLVTLRDVFDDDALYRALSSDPTVRRRIPKGDQPGSLAALLSTLGESPPDVGCSFDPEDLLHHFALGEASGSGVIIELGAPGSGACRYALTRLTLRLPTPGALRPAISELAAGRGFTRAHRPAGLPTVHVRMTSDELGYGATKAAPAAPAPAGSSK